MPTSATGRSAYLWYRRKPEEVAEVAKKMEAIGVDMIGLMTGMSYEGVAAGEIPEQIKAR